MTTALQIKSGHVKATPCRMLSLREAADYCGQPMKRFALLCPVAAISMPNDARLYDIKDLDAWLDSLKTPSLQSDDAIIARLGKSVA